MDYGDIRIIGDRVIITPANGTVWLTKHQIADLFEVFISKVSSNITIILETGLLNDDIVYCRHRYDDGNFVELYNLEMITALSFRIRSANADAFRRWLMVQAVARKRTLIAVPLSDKTLLN